MYTSKITSTVFVSLVYIRSSFTAQWMWMDYPLSQISATATPVKSRGALVARVSQKSHLLVVGVNQRCCLDNQLLFADPVSGALITVDMRNCGMTGKVVPGRLL